MASLSSVTEYVSVRDLAVSAVIGVHPWERDVEQTLVVSVDMATDVRKAAASDDLADALDYSAVAATIAAVLRDGKFRLIETAADHVAGRLLSDFPLSWLRLELRKPITNAPAPHTPPASTRRPGRHPSRVRPGRSHGLYRRNHHRTHPRNSMIMKDL